MEYLFDLVSTFVWAGVALVLLVLGLFVVDLLAPGKLGDQIFGSKKNANAGLIAAAGALGTSGIVATAIATSAEGFGAGVLSAIVYSLIGFVAVAVSFKIVDALTPGDLRRLFVEPVLQPGTFLVAASHVGICAVVATAIA